MGVERDCVDELVDRLGAGRTSGATMLTEDACPSFAERDVAMRDETLAVAEAALELAARRTRHERVPLLGDLGDDSGHEHGTQAWAEAVLVDAEAEAGKRCHEPVFSHGAQGPSSARRSIAACRKARLSADRREGVDSEGLGGFFDLTNPQSTLAECNNRRLFR